MTVVMTMTTTRTAGLTSWWAQVGVVVTECNSSLLLHSYCGIAESAWNIM
jgi:hypothetical protein